MSPDRIRWEMFTNHPGDAATELSHGGQLLVYSVNKIGLPSRIASMLLNQADAYKEGREKKRTTCIINTSRPPKGRFAL